MFKVLKRKECTKHQWNACADRITTAWAWHRWELIDARETWNRTSDLSFAIAEKNNPSVLLALVCLVLVRPNGLAGMFGPHLEGTGGPVIDSNQPRRTQEKLRTLIVDELQNLSEQHNARRIDFSCPPLAPELLDSSAHRPNPLCYFDAIDTSTQSWILNISEKGEDELWKTVEHRCRKQVNKAQRNQLSARTITPDAQLLEPYYKLHTQTCERNGITPHPYDYFETIFNAVSSAGLCKSVIIGRGSDILAIQNFLIYKNSALYWTTAGSNDALKLCANDFGIWHAIKELRDTDINYFECGEAFPAKRQGKLKGLNDFKKSFGGELYPYFRGKIVYRPITESLMNIARQLRKGRTGK